MPHLPPDVARHLSKWRPSLRVSEAQRVGQGWNAVAWRVPSDDGDWLVRVPRRSGATEEMRRQTCLYRLLTPRGLPVPIDAELVLDSGGVIAAAAYRFADGEHAARERNRGRRRALLAAQLSQFLTELHSTPLKQVRECGITARNKWRRYEEWMTWHDDRFGPATRQYLKRLREQWAVTTSGGGIPQRLIHADLVPEHIIVNGGGIVSSVLDFGGPQIADPAVDFASLGRHYGWSFADQVLAEYASNERTAIRARARLYERVLPLHAVDAGVVRDEPSLQRHGLRQLAAQAARSPT